MSTFPHARTAPDAALPDVVRHIDLAREHLDAYALTTIWPHGGIVECADLLDAARACLSRHAKV